MSKATSSQLPTISTPDIAKKLADPRNPSVIALYDGTVFTFISRKDRYAETIGQIICENNPARKLDSQSELIVKQIADSNLPLLLRMSNDLGLLTEERLPVSASEDLRAIIQNRLDILTPWNDEHAYFDAVEVEHNKEQAHIIAKIAAVDRSTVDTAIRQLAQLGLSVHAVDVQLSDPADPPHINLLGGFPKRQPTDWKMLAASAAMILLIAGGAIGLFDHYTRSSEITERREFSEQLRQRVADLPEIRRQMEVLRGQSGFIDTVRRNNHAAVFALEEMSKLLPDGVWLDRLQYQDQEITISGYAPNAEDLLALIESSTLFEAAEFRAPSRARNVDVSGQNQPVDEFLIGLRLSGKAQNQR